MLENWYESSSIGFVGCNGTSVYHIANCNHPHLFKML